MQWSSIAAREALPPQARSIPTFSRTGTPLSPYTLSDDLFQRPPAVHDFSHLPLFLDCGELVLPHGPARVRADNGLRSYARRHRCNAGGSTPDPLARTNPGLRRQNDPLIPALEPRGSRAHPECGPDRQPHVPCRWQSPPMAARPRRPGCIPRRRAARQLDPRCGLRLLPARARRSFCRLVRTSARSALEPLYLVRRGAAGSRRPGRGISDPAERLAVEHRAPNRAGVRKHAALPARVL